MLPHGLKIPVLEEKNVIGGGYGENRTCPICGSIDRERLLYCFLTHKTDLFTKPYKLLHVAPEPKLTPILSAQTNIDYLTADLISERVMVKMDITDIQYANEFFDAIICNHVLEHIIDDGKAMSELFRVLVPGGWAILQVPISLTLNQTYEDASKTTEADRVQYFGQKDHVRIYAQDYLSRLESAGFHVEPFKWITEADYFGGKKNKYCLNEKELIFCARKI